MNAKDIKHRLKTGQPVEKWQLANLIEEQEKLIKELEQKVAFLEDKVVMVDPQEYGFKYLYGDDLLEAQKRINNLLRNMVDELDVRKNK